MDIFFTTAYLNVRNLYQTATNLISLTKTRIKIHKGRNLSILLNDVFPTFKIVVKT